MTRVAVVLAAALALGGCGDADGGETVSEFLTRADAICARGGDDDLALADVVERVYDDEGSAGALDDAAETFGEGVETFEGIVADLRELDAPAEIAADYEDAVDLLDRLVVQLEQGLDAAAAGDADAFEAAVEDAGFAEEADELEQLADRIGFEECGIEETGD